MEKTTIKKDSVMNKPKSIRSNSSEKKVLFDGIEWGTIENILSERIQHDCDNNFCMLCIEINIWNKSMVIWITYTINDDSDFILIRKGDKIGIEYRVILKKVRAEKITQIIMRCHLREFCIENTRRVSFELGN